MAYIMVIDDDQDLAESTAIVLRGAGHEVAVSLEMEQAVKMMRARRPDLAVVDVMFPGNKTGGFDLARRMAAEFGKPKKIPIILLTSVNTEYQLGFSGQDLDEEWMPAAAFMEKPVDFTTLKAKVQDLLRK